VVNSEKEVQNGASS